jgi:hypothetical protein
LFQIVHEKKMRRLADRSTIEDNENTTNPKRDTDAPYHGQCDGTSPPYCPRHNKRYEPILTEQEQSLNSPEEHQHTRLKAGYTQSVAPGIFHRQDDKRKGGKGGQKQPFNRYKGWQ